MYLNSESVIVSVSDLSVVQNLLAKYAVPDDLVEVRLSSRAKRLIFKSSVKKGVEIVVPLGSSSSWVAKGTESRIPWIKDSQQRVRQGRNQLNPIHVNLKALGEIWHVDYGRIDEVPNGLTVDGEHSLTVGVHPEDVFHAARKLQEWFQRKARVSLLPWLDSLAEDRRLKFNRTYVRNQVSRWGSCSAKRNISLNRNLLFIPGHLVEYVLHHELTHLEHMNHSMEFWSSFTRVIANCRELSRELGSLNPDDIPLWAAPGLDRV